MLTALVLLLAAQIAEEDWQRPTAEQPVAFVDRPLTLPERNFGVDFDLGYTRLSPRMPFTAVSGGAGYGIDDDFEVGIRLIDVTFSPAAGSGFQEPTLFLAYRALEGFLEIAGRLEASLPVGEEFRFAAEIPILIHIAGIFRIDLAARFSGLLDQTLLSSASAPVALSVQIIPQLILQVGAEATMVDVRGDTILGVVRGGVFYTIEGDRGPFADIGVAVVSPALTLRGLDPEPPFMGNDFQLVAASRFFFFQGDERSEPDDF